MIALQNEIMQFLYLQAHEFTLDNVQLMAENNKIETALAELVWKEVE